VSERQMSFSLQDALSKAKSKVKMSIAELAIAKQAADAAEQAARDAFSAMSTFDAAMSAGNAELFIAQRDNVHKARAEIKRLELEKKVGLELVAQAESDIRAEIQRLQELVAPTVAHTVAPTGTAEHLTTHAAISQPTTLEGSTVIDVAPETAGASSSVPPVATAPMPLATAPMPVAIAAMPLATAPSMLPSQPNVNTPATVPSSKKRKLWPKSPTNPLTVQFTKGLEENGKSGQRNDGLASKYTESVNMLLAPAQSGFQKSEDFLTSDAQERARSVFAQIYKERSPSTLEKRWVKDRMCAFNAFVTYLKEEREASIATAAGAPGPSTAGGSGSGSAVEELEMSEDEDEDSPAAKRPCTEGDEGGGGGGQSLTACSQDSVYVESVD